MDILIQKEKAHLSVEILTQFAPAMDGSVELFNKMINLTEDFNRLIEMFSNLPEDQLTTFMNFMNDFTDYIKTSTATHSLLSDFHKYLSTKTNSLVDEYKIAANVI
jgi:hypothetical protein